MDQKLLDAVVELQQESDVQLSPGIAAGMAIEYGMADGTLDWDPVNYDESNLHFASGVPTGMRVA